MSEFKTITWHHLYRELFAFVYPKVRDKFATQDIIQDVFIKVHTKAHQVKEAEKITGWIYQVTRNAVADYFRKNAKMVTQATVDWESDHHEFNECVAQCLKSLMESLPEKYRTALQLTEIESLSQFELATRLNISHSGARSRVQRARKMLKDKLNALYRIETDAYGNVIICENRVDCCCKHEC
jgi:RNA polymerase sigma-70 factor, ECF subfamily